MHDVSGTLSVDQDTNDAGDNLVADVMDGIVGNLELMTPILSNRNTIWQMVQMKGK